LLWLLLMTLLLFTALSPFSLLSLTHLTIMDWVI
jgi:hypothetical protein